MAFGRAGLSVIFMLLVVRTACELSMMNEYGSDAQMGIWAMFMGAKLLFWLVTGAVSAALAEAAWKGRWRWLGAVAALAWVVAIGWSSLRYGQAARALHEASATSTSSARLTELVDFDGIQAGYELDNRIASNPNTTPEALRKLHARGNLGTLMSLKSNPNTPDDVRRELARRSDLWRTLASAAKRFPPPRCD